MFERDEETAALGRKATVLKNAGDMNGAVVCLRQARERMIVSPVHYSMDAWCRLPLLLQQAGRMDEAREAFQWVLDDLPRKARKESFMDDPNVSFGRDTPKSAVYKQIIKVGRDAVKRALELAEKREERRLAKEMKQKS